MNPRINKLTPPLDEAVLPRQRLFLLLDECRSRRVVWIHGPGGAGKSTLAASYLADRGLTTLWYQVDTADRDPANLFYYFGELSQTHGLRADLPLLTPEYRLGIETFTRRYFEAFFHQLPLPAALVLDDLHEAEDETFHHLLNIALQETPEGVSVLVLSRTPPPPALARLRANRRLALLEWDSLRLDPGETSGIVDLYRPTAPQRANLAERIHQKTDGWVAGVILLLEGGQDTEPLMEDLDGENADDIFSYFAGELFERISPHQRSFFLRTALLPELTPEMAAQLTGHSDPSKLLEELHLRNLFIEKRLLPTPTYRYHPLFREFLCHRANSELPPKDLAELQRTSAGLLEAADNPSEAAELYRAGRHWPDLAQLIHRHAEALLSQGRSDTLRDWLLALPESQFTSDPWLAYWLGLSSMTLSFDAARKALEQALAGFRNACLGQGAYLAWAAIVDTYAFELDHLTPLDGWLDVFAELQGQFPDFPAPEVELRVTASMFVSLVLRPTRTEQIAEWSARLEKLLLTNDNLPVSIQTGFYRAVYAVWTGNLRKSAAIVQELRTLVDNHPVPPLMQLTVLMLEAMHGWLTGQRQDCMRAVEKGLELTAKTGIKTWELLFYSCGAEGSMIDRDLDTARKMYQQIEAGSTHASSLMKSYLHIQATWMALTEDDPVTALFHLGEARPQIERLGSPYHLSLWYIGKAMAEILAGELDAVEPLLQEAQVFADRIGSRMIRFLLLLCRARRAYAQGDSASGSEALSLALRIGREEDYRFWIWFLPRQFSELCHRALQAEIETGYVQGLICERNLLPPAGAEVSPNWPWPFKVTTLGDFAIDKKGQRLAATGKTPKKPLELLKALVAHGGREVDEIELYDDLWPNGDPLTACKTLKTTLHRLRKLLDDDQAVQFHEGRLSINRQRVWVDAWAFESLLGRARSAWQSGHSKQAAPYIEQALELYQGHFLPADEDKPWSHSRRERLRERFVINVARIGEVFKANGQTEQAIECYRRSLEIDDRTEALYRQLMSCYQQAGLIDEAVAVYQRCQKILAAVGAEPSRQTHTLFQSLL